MFGRFDLAALLQLPHLKGLLFRISQGVSGEQQVFLFVWTPGGNQAFPGEQQGLFVLNHTVRPQAQCGHGGGVCGQVPQCFVIHLYLRLC